MTEWQRPPIPKILQLNRRAAALVCNHRQLATITAQGGFLLLFRQERSRGTLRSAAAPGRHQADHEQQQRGEADQSSKRELLSRGRELRGGVRPGPVGAQLGMRLPRKELLMRGHCWPVGWGCTPRLRQLACRECPGERRAARSLVLGCLLKDGTLRPWHPPLHGAKLRCHRVRLHWDGCRGVDHLSVCGGRRSWDSRVNARRRDCRIAPCDGPARYHHPSPMRHRGDLACGWRPVQGWRLWSCDAADRNPAPVLPPHQSPAPQNVA